MNKNLSECLSIIVIIVILAVFFLLLHINKNNCIENSGKVITDRFGMYKGCIYDGKE